MAVVKIVINALKPYANDFVLRSPPKDECPAGPQHSSIIWLPLPLIYFF